MHRTYMGTRYVRGATPDQGGPLHFARCRCGWAGPSRLRRAAAVLDGLDHCSETVDRRE